MKLRTPPAKVRFTVAGMALTCLLAIALLLVAGFRFSPHSPQTTHNVLQRAAAASGSRAALRYYGEGHSALTRNSNLAESNKRVAWTFAEGVPSGWSVSQNARNATVGTATVIETDPKNFAKQMTAPATTLPAGDYQIVVEGRVTQGGLALGAERGTTCLGNSFFSADQWRGRRDQTLMVRPLRLANRQTVRVVLSNWAYPDGASTWQIRRVYIRSLSLPEKEARTYATQASPLVDTSKLLTNAYMSWIPKRSLRGWFRAADAQVARSPAGLAVRTGKSLYGYELTSQVNLGPGPYLLRVSGKIKHGGITLGAADVRTDKWLGQAYYWSGQNGSGGAKAVLFRVKRAGPVELVLANWSVLEPASSSWLLTRIELVRRF